MFSIRNEIIVFNELIYFGIVLKNAAPNFVSSFAHGDYVYFTFRETAVEYMNCGKVSRSMAPRSALPSNAHHYNLIALTFIITVIAVVMITIMIISV